MRLGGKWPQMTRELELPLANRTGKRSEEEPPAMHENERSGARISTSWVSPGWPRNLNFSNRPVRTRMPGGVAGVPGVMIRGPYADQGVIPTQPGKKGKSNYALRNCTASCNNVGAHFT